MELNIPNEFAPVLQQKATAAGFDDIAQYVVHLVECDEASVSQYDEEWIPEPNDPRIIQAIEDGSASGDGGPMDAQFFQKVRDELRAKYGASQTADMSNG